MLARPKARSSLFGLLSTTLVLLSEALMIVMELKNPKIAKAAAKGSKSLISNTSKTWRDSEGSPLGMRPISRTPISFQLKYALATVAKRTTRSAMGIFGAYRFASASASKALIPIAVVIAITPNELLSCSAGMRKDASPKRGANWLAPMSKTAAFVKPLITGLEKNWIIKPIFRIPNRNWIIPTIKVNKMADCM